MSRLAMYADGQKSSFPRRVRFFRILLELACWVTIWGTSCVLWACRQPSSTAASNGGGTASEVAADKAAEIKAAEIVVRHGDHIEIPPGSPLRGRLTIAAAEYHSVRRSLEAPAEVEADPARLARITPPLPGR